jgi:hypothetical protein
MAETKNRFQRPLGDRRYRKLFVISTEGQKTEPAYFDKLNNQYTTIHLHCMCDTTGHVDPSSVLKRIKLYLKDYSLKNTDEAWLVVDKDNWTDEQLQQLYEWSKQRDNFGLALSNPKFEYWLLLHFDNGGKVTNSAQCSKRLKRHLPNYDKGVHCSLITNDKVEAAIQRAKLRDNPRCEDWPREVGTTVYRLVERILAAGKEQQQQ